MPEIDNTQAASASTGNTGNTSSTINTNNDPETNQNINIEVPLVFLKESELFGNRRPERLEWLQHVELYRAIGQRIDTSHISGLQRVRGMWRIYLDNLTDKVKLMAEGVPLRGKVIPVLNTNPDRLDGEQTTRVRVQNIPLSADDNIIKRVLTLTGADVISIYRERLRVDNKLTACETGDRIIIVKTSSLKEPLPKFMTFGTFTGKVYHVGQPKHNPSKPLKCGRCLQDGHLFRNCPNDWVCTLCTESGHKRADCPKEQIDTWEADSSDSESSDEESEPEMPVSPTKSKEKQVRNSSVKTNVSDRRKVKAGKNRQQSIEKFVTPAKPTVNNTKVDRSPPTPAEELHDKLQMSKKKQKQLSKK
jgi:hypothetical protein